MPQKKEFGEGILYTITNYIWWFLLGNIYFGVLNIPLIFTLLIYFIRPVTVSLPQGFGFVFFLSLIPIGPAITALCGVMGKLVREKDAYFTRDFFKYYKMNFRQSLLIWVAELSILSILYMDLKYFKPQGSQAFSVFFMVIAVLITVWGLYSYPLISRFYFKTLDVIKLSIYYSIKKFKITIFMICNIIIGIFLILKVASIFLLCIIGIITFMNMYYLKDLFIEIEGQMNSKEEEKNSKIHVEE
jgi:uncharacterized membrane protein YesL